ncbi:MAG: lipocalin family protein [Alistipes sp.]|nr:lipocalin family protein [Alistipes sp.]
MTAIVLSTLASAKSYDIDRTTVSDIDLKRYMGRWFEIARFDHSFERNLDYCEAFYALQDDGTISVTNTGLNSRTEKRKTAYGKAKLGERPGQLRVSFFWFFYSDYNILALSQEYEWALIGSKSEKYLWILSRTRHLDSNTRNNIVAIAQSRGYDTSKLIWVKQ